VKRREFISLLGGAAAAWPLAARAQQGELMRRVGVLLPATADDAEFQARFGAFLQALALLGWTIGRNVRIDTRWATTDAAEIRRHAAELAALAPDVILAHAATPWGRCCRRPAPYRSCSRPSSIRSAPASSTAWRGRAATPPVS
jgi:putative ABC transport system substrate-binding protein